MPEVHPSLMHDGAPASSAQLRKHGHGHAALHDDGMDGTIGAPVDMHTAEAIRQPL